MNPVRSAVTRSTSMPTLLPVPPEDQSRTNQVAQTRLPSEQYETEGSLEGRVSPRTFDYTLEDLQSLTDNEDYVKALEVLETLEKEENTLEWYKYIGDLSLEAQVFDVALECFSTLIDCQYGKWNEKKELRSKQKVAMLGVGMWCLEVCEFNEAFRHLFEAYQMDPHPDTLRGFVLLSNKCIETYNDESIGDTKATEATEIAEQCLSTLQTKKDHDYKVDEQRIAHALAEIYAAKCDFSKAFKLAPDYVRRYLEREQEGDSDDFFAGIRDLIQIDATSDISQKCLELLQRAQQATSEELSMLVLIYYKQGNDEQVLDVDPDHIPSLLRKSKQAKEQRDHTLMLSYCERILKAQPKDAQRFQALQMIRSVEQVASIAKKDDLVIRSGELLQQYASLSEEEEKDLTSAHFRKGSVDKALARNSSHLPSLLKQGERHRSKERYGDALQCFKKAVERAEEEEAKQQALGQVMAIRKQCLDSPNAGECFRLICAHKSLLSGEERKELVEALYEEKAYEHALEIDPAHVHSLLQLWDLLKDSRETLRLEKLGKQALAAALPKVAVPCFKQLKEIGMQMGKIEKEIIRVASGLNDETVAHTYLDFVLEINPRNVQALYVQAEIWKRGCHTDEEIRCYDAILQVSPDETEAYRLRGYAYQTQGNNEQALGDYEQACKHGLRDAAIFFTMAELYDDQQKKITFYSKTLSCNPLHALAANRVREVLDKPQHGRDLESCVCKVFGLSDGAKMKEHPLIKTLLLQLGTAYEVIDRKFALSCCELGNQIDPSNLQFLEKQLNIMLAQEKYKEVIAICNRLEMSKSKLQLELCYGMRAKARQQLLRSELAVMDYRNAIAIHKSSKWLVQAFELRRPYDVIAGMLDSPQTLEQVKGELNTLFECKIDQLEERSMLKKQIAELFSLMPQIYVEQNVTLALDCLDEAARIGGFDCAPAKEATYHALAVQMQKMDGNFQERVQKLFGCTQDELKCREDDTLSKHVIEMLAVLARSYQEEDPKAAGECLNVALYLDPENEQLVPFKLEISQQLLKNVRGLTDREIARRHSRSKK